jgi:hypothetical protein
VVARGHHALARVDTAEGKSSDANRHQAEATRIVNEIYNEAGTETIRKRTDLALVTGAR